MYRATRHRRVGNGNGMLYMLALHAASQFMQLPRKPPVTAALIAANTLVYFRPGPLGTILPGLHDVCLSPHRVIKDLDLKRLYLSAFYHVDDAHLIYNMISLLWKGVQLESELGSKRFAGMVTVLLGLSHGLVVVSAKLLATFADYPGPMYAECAVGFSSVLFALKMVLNWTSPNFTNVYGVPLPARYAAWAELLVVQMFVPGTSFLGHLCGILAGLLYIQGNQVLTGSHSPFSLMWRFLRRPLSWLVWPLRPRRGRIHGHGSTGTSNSPWRCRACTFDNAGILAVCDMCGTPKGLEMDQGYSEGEEPSAPPWPEQDISSSSFLTRDELRQARLARFNRR